MRNVNTARRIRAIAPMMIPTYEPVGRPLFCGALLSDGEGDGIVTVGFKVPELPGKSCDCDLDMRLRNEESKTVGRRRAHASVPAAAERYLKKPNEHQKPQ